MTQLNKNDLEKMDLELQKRIDQFVLAQKKLIRCLSSIKEDLTTKADIRINDLVKKIDEGLKEVRDILKEGKDGS